MSEDYETHKKEHLAQLEARFMEELKNYKDEWQGWDYYDDTNFWTRILKLALENGAKFNDFCYDDTYYRCGDRYGNKYGLLTPLSESELKEKMREFALKNMGNYCHEKFLNSVQCGIHYNGDAEFFSDSICYSSMSLNEIQEKDIYTKEEFSEITRKREEEKRLKFAREQAEAQARCEQQERSQYEKLKAKFEQKGN